ncbi:MAG: hypothetical protein ACRCVU_13770 [Flavobacterium sp.]
MGSYSLSYEAGDKIVFKLRTGGELTGAVTYTGGRWHDYGDSSFFGFTLDAFVTLGEFQSSGGHTSITLCGCYLKGIISKIGESK